jgi:hypothetical protein
VISDKRERLSGVGVDSRGGKKDAVVESKDAVVESIDGVVGVASEQPDDHPEDSKSSRGFVHC